MCVEIDIIKEFDTSRQLNGILMEIDMRVILVIPKKNPVKNPVKNPKKLLKNEQLSINQQFFSFMFSIKNEELMINPIS